LHQPTKLLQSFLQVLSNHNKKNENNFCLTITTTTIGTVEGLLKDLPTLTSILTYHVVSGKVLAETVVTLDGKKLKTVNGAEVAVSVGADGVIEVNSAKVIATDIVTDNGVIHAIDSVLIPPAAAPPLLAAGVLPPSLSKLIFP
jgi:uncharacterized surface protein with fasciclin (FAS1) repeats